MAYRIYNDCGDGHGFFQGVSTKDQAIRIADEHTKNAKRSCVVMETGGFTEVYRTTVKKDPVVEKDPKIANLIAVIDQLAAKVESANVYGFMSAVQNVIDFRKRITDY